MEQHNIDLDKPACSGAMKKTLLFFAVILFSGLSFSQPFQRNSASTNIIPMVYGITSIQTFGGTPGATNDYALQAAFNAVTNGLVLTPGTYLLTNTASSPAENMVWITNQSFSGIVYGYGAVLKRAASTYGRRIVLAITNSARITFEGITFDDNYTDNNAGPQLAFFDTQSGKPDLTFKNCVFTNIAFMGLSINSGGRVTLDGCVFDGPAITGTGSGAQFFAGNGAGEVIVKNCSFRNAGTATANNQAIYAGSYQSLAVSGCYFTNCAAGISARSTNTIISGNTFAGGPNGVDAADTTAYSIQCIGVGGTLSRAVVDHNVIFDEGKRYGIVLTSLSTNCLVANNWISMKGSVAFGGINCTDSGYHSIEGNAIECRENTAGYAMEIFLATNISFRANLIKGGRYAYRVADSTSTASVFGDFAYGQTTYAKLIALDASVPDNLILTNQLTFSAGGTTVRALSVTANTGLGTTSPYSRLSLGSSFNERLALREDVSQTGFYGVSAWNVGGTFGVGIWAGTGAGTPTTVNPGVLLDANGNLGVGRTNAVGKVDVLGDVRVSTTVSATNGVYIFSPNGTRFKIKVSDGGVLSANAE